MDGTDSIDSGYVGTGGGIDWNSALGTIANAYVTGEAIKLQNTRPVIVQQDGAPLQLSASGRVGGNASSLLLIGGLVLVVLLVMKK